MTTKLSVYKVVFDAKNPDTTEWDRAWQYFDSTAELKTFLSEVMDSKEVETRNFQVMMVQADGWTPVEIKRADKR